MRVARSAAGTAIRLGSHGYYRGPMLDERRQVVFLHIPKTAGTTLRSVLTDRFEGLPIFPDAETMSKFGGYAPVAHLESLDGEVRSRFALIMGHYTWPAVRALVREPFRISVVRDPLARTISELKHIQRVPTHFLREQIGAGSVDTAAILNSDPGRHYLKNRQIRTFAPTLSEAVDVLNSMEFVGVHERLGDSIRLLARLLGWPEPEHPPRRLNRAPAMQEELGLLTDEDRGIVEELIAQDRKFYDIACELFADRFDAEFGTPEPSPHLVDDLTYFLHIPKAAGTTLRALLKANFRQTETVLGYDQPASEWYDYRFDELVAPELGIRFFAAHLDWTLVERARHRTVRVVTMLRDPIDRTISAYRHFQRHQGFTGSLSDFIEQHPNQVVDVQARRLAGDPDGLAERDEIARTALNRLGDPRLIFGISESFERSVDHIMQRLGFERPASSRRLNAAPTPHAPSDAERALIAPLVEADVALYRAAVDRFEAVASG